MINLVFKEDTKISLIVKETIWEIFQVAEEIGKIEKLCSVIKEDGWLYKIGVL